MIEFSAMLVRQKMREACEKLKEQKSAESQKQYAEDLLKLATVIIQCEKEINNAAEQGEHLAFMKHIWPSIWPMLAEHFEKLGFHIHSFKSDINNTIFYCIKW